MNIADTRAAIAAALNSVSGLNVKARPVTNNVRPNDGWVTSPSLEVADFASSLAEFDVVVVLSSDPVKAEQRYDEVALAVLNAAAELDASDVTVAPQLIPAGDGVPAPLYTLVLTVKMEVQ